MAKEKIKKPWYKVLIKVVVIIALVVCVFLFGVREYFRLPVASYYLNSDKTFVIPDSNNNFIAQGISYDSTSSKFFVTGYMKDKSPSPVYVVDKNGKKYDKKVFLKTSSGEDYKGHAGGLSVNGKYVYESYGSGLLVYSYDTFMATENGSSVEALGYFSAKVTDDDYVGVSCTTIHDGYLYIAEFYRAGNYETLQSHRFTTAAGDENKAIMAKFKLDDTKEFGIDPNLVEVYSITSQVQGIVFDNEGHVFMSTSYGPAFSYIYAYDISKAAKMSDVTVLGKSVSCYAIDSSNLVKQTKIAPMSEEIEIVDGKLYTMCESASNKYIFGKFTSAKYCYATNVSYLLNK